MPSVPTATTLLLGREQERGGRKQNTSLGVATAATERSAGKIVPEGQTGDTSPEITFTEPQHKLS